MKNLKDINWNHLYYFYEVARSQSLKGGAKIAGVTSATLSEQLKSLEKKFGLDLFIRSSKGLTLTSNGQKLFERVKIIFEEGSRILDEFSSEVIGGYSVNIGIEDSISHDIATEISSQYWDLYTKYGAVNTRRQSEHSVLVENLATGNIDWGISLRKPKRKSLNYEEIESFEINFYCATDLYHKFKDVKDLLTNIPFALTSVDSKLNTEILKYLKNNNVIPKETIVSDHPAFINKLCQRGRCVMFAPQNPFEQHDSIKSFSFETPLKISLYAIWPKKNDNLISTIKLKKLIDSKISSLPNRYSDIDFQIEVSDITDDMLK